MTLNRLHREERSEAAIQRADARPTFFWRLESVMSDRLRFSTARQVFEAFPTAAEDIEI